MSESGVHPAVKLLIERGVPMRARDFMSQGVNRMTLHRLVANSVIERVGNGVYRLPNKIGMFDDWAAIASRYPDAVIATLSAAVFHRTTQEMPGSIHVAFPRSKGRSRAPASFPVETKVLRWGGTEEFDPFSVGVEVHEIDSVQVRITDPERTLVDMFRYSPFNSSVRDTAIHVSEEAVLDCLQRTVAREDFSIDGLFERADAARVLRQMSPLIKNAMYALAHQPESLSI
jgi:predicted transcriptional regulator of viral defense system